MSDRTPDGKGNPLPPQGTGKDAGLSESGGAVHPKYDYDRSAELATSLDLDKAVMALRLRELDEKEGVEKPALPQSFVERLRRERAEAQAKGKDGAPTR